MSQEYTINHCRTLGTVFSTLVLSTWRSPEEIETRRLGLSVLVKLVKHRWMAWLVVMWVGWS